MFSTMSEQWSNLTTLFILIILISIMIILPGIGSTSAVNTNATNEHLNSVTEKQGISYRFELQSGDKLITEGHVKNKEVTTTQKLRAFGKWSQQYYINNKSPDVESYHASDYLIRILSLSNHPISYDGYYIHKFELGNLAIESNGNGRLEKAEPMFKDVDGDFHLTQSDYISKNGTISMESMSNANATYFNSINESPNYNKGQAIVSLNSNNQLVEGPLDKGVTSVLLRGNAPLKGFDETSDTEYAFNLGDSNELINNDTAILKTDFEGALISGGLNNGATKIIKPGKAEIKGFDKNKTFHVDAIEPSLAQFNRQEVLIRDSDKGDNGTIDSNDEVVKAGKGFAKLFQSNISTYKSGNVFIGGSNGDQIYTTDEFLYVDSGGSPGYQPNEDIVISNGSGIDLTKPHDTPGTYNVLNNSGQSNLVFLDLNNNKYLDVRDGLDSKEGSEPIIHTQTGSLKNSKNVTLNDSFLEATSGNGSFKDIGGNWFSKKNYQELIEATGSHSGGTIRYIQSADNKINSYQVGEAILEDVEKNYTLDRSDFILTSSDPKNSSHEKIPVEYHFLNLNHSTGYKEGYPVISLESRVETSLNESDRIVSAGNLKSVNNFSKNVEFVDQDESNTYSKNEGIINSKEPGDNKIEFEDEILNTKSSPGRVQISFMSSYPSDVNSEMQVFLSKNQSDSYSLRDPIVNLNSITILEGSEKLAGKQMTAFSKETGFLDSNLDSELNNSEAIYRENDTQTVGTDTFGDRLTALTVENNGTLADRHIEAITLRANSTAITNTTAPTPNGSWVLEPENDTGWFGPENSTEFELVTTVAADAPGGETVTLEIPPVTDSDGDGAYDPGDAGLFFEQDSPLGGLGPGSTLTVPNDPSGHSQPPEPSPMALTIHPLNASVAASADTLSMTISSNVSDRSIEATLQHATNGTAEQTVTTNLNHSGVARVGFDTVPGRYQVRVEAVVSNGSALSDPFVVEHPGTPGFVNRTESVARGELAPFEVALGSHHSATIRLKAPDGRVLEEVGLVAGNQSSPYTIAVDTNGMGERTSGSGFTFQPRDSGSANSSWISAFAPNRSATATDDRDLGRSNKSETGTPNPGETANASAHVETNPTTARPQNATGPTTEVRSGGAGRARALPVGEYTISLSSSGKQHAVAEFQVRASWTVSLETLVAPRDVSLSSPADVRTHATRRSEIAAGDQVVMAVNTTGLGRYARNISVAKNGPKSNRSERERRAGNETSAVTPRKGTPQAYISVGPKTGPNGTVSTRGVGPHRIDGPNSGDFYVVSQPTVTEVQPGTELGTAVVLTGESPFVAGTDRNGSATETYAASLEVVEARADFDGVSADGALDLPPQAAVSVNGSTTVAPGTTVSVHIDGTTESFSIDNTATVDDDGTYQTTTDLSDYESGTEYTVTVTADGEQLSPVRSGEFIDVGSKTNAAIGGGSMYGNQAADSSSGQAEASITTESIDGNDDSRLDPLTGIPTETARRAWRAVPEPLRIGLPALLVSGLSSLALLTVTRGILRLVRL